MSRMASAIWRPTPPSTMRKGICQRSALRHQARASNAARPNNPWMLERFPPCRYGMSQIHGTLPLTQPSPNGEGARSQPLLERRLSHGERGNRVRGNALCADRCP